MAYFLFIDESGQDRRESPYEVLAGVAVRDSYLGRLSEEAHKLEIKHFGRRYSRGRNELKGTKLLKKKVFQHLALNVWVDPARVTELAKSALENGQAAGIMELKALATAKRNFVYEILDLCIRYDCRAFASIIEIDAPDTTTDGLRKDYAYLFERFFYFLKDMGGQHQGAIVFDELEKSKSHILVDQMERYFRNTATGKARSRLIIPEPLFVHSDLTTGVQFSDLVAYIVSWGWRAGKINKPGRPELQQYGEQVKTMRYQTQRPEKNGQSFLISSFAHIRDLRTNLERLAERAIEEGEE